MASPTPPDAECPTQSSLLALPDVNLEDIFLRLPTPAALARASLACAAFRRIITERSFLRRFRKLHPPPLLGIIDDEGVFAPTEAPHPSAPLSRALVQGADFTYSFVPKPLDLAVCDPLSRRYLLLPPIPEDMTIEQERLYELRHFLIPIRENEDETSLKVICLAYYRSKLVTFIFSSVTGQWCIAASTSWSSLGVVDPFRKLFSC
uniref:F-box domain-containing protein n=1 Tax=Triticum urartu TaxID=4572 RepID=A0A8R7URT7_TRIUA